MSTSASTSASQVIIEKSAASNSGVEKALGVSASNGNLFNLFIIIKKFIAVADQMAQIA